jgi:multimeric flavodoxin WrbA
MQILLIEDGEVKTNLAEDLLASLTEIIRKKGHQIKTIKVTKENCTSCMGCFGCWLKTPGECVINDLLNNINSSVVNSDYVFYFGPIVFGQYGSTMKNVLDRSIANVLPFFEKSNGRTKHPHRYERNPEKIYIGYSDNKNPAEKTSFINIIRKRDDCKNIYVLTSKENILEITTEIDKTI